jgi:hypothetical protein
MAPEVDPDSPVDYGAQEVQKLAGKAAAGGYDKDLDTLTGGVGGAGAKILAFAFSILDALIILAVRAIGKVLGQLDPAFGALAAAVVGQMFDVSVPTAAFTSMTDKTERRELSKSVGGALLKAFKGDQVDAGAGGLTPSVDAAENYLGIMTGLAIEGWVFDVFGGLVPFVHLDHIGDLKDSIARVLGLGRMSRAVLRPFVNTLIAQPAQWSVNKQYRPRMLGTGELLDAWRRGNVNEETVDEVLARDGYGDDSIRALKRNHWRPLSASDVHFLIDAQYWDTIRGLNELSVTTADDERSRLELTLEDQRALHRFELDMIAAAADAYAARRIDEPTFTRLIGGDTINPTTAARVHELAAQRRLVNVQHMSRADVESAVENGVLSVTDLHDWLDDRGYAEQDAITIELNMQARLAKIADAQAARAAATAKRQAAAAAKAQAAVAKRDQLAAEHADFSGTLAQAERLYVRGLMSAVTYRATLVDHGVTSADADALLTAATQDRDARAALLAKRAAAGVSNAPRALALATLIHAARIGVRSIDDVRSTMQARGYSAADIQLEVDELTAEIATAQAAAAKRGGVAGQVRTPTLTLGQLERSVLDGVLTVDQYGAVLASRGVSATDIATLVADLRVRLDARAFAEQRRALAEQRLEASHLSLATEEKAVIEGLKTMGDFQAFLASKGFDVDDQAVLIDLLTLKIG